MSGFDAEARLYTTAFGPPRNVVGVALATPDGRLNGTLDEGGGPWLLIRDADDDARVCSPADLSPATRAVLAAMEDHLRPGAWLLFTNHPRPQLHAVWPPTPACVEFAAAAAVLVGRVYTPRVVHLQLSADGHWPAPAPRFVNLGHWTTLDGLRRAAAKLGIAEPVDTYVRLFARLRTVLGQGEVAAP